jgi:hypothetical protein
MTFSPYYAKSSLDGTIILVTKDDGNKLSGYVVESKNEHYQVHTFSRCWNKCPFTKINYPEVVELAIEYRMLKENEVIEEGDEYLYNGCWCEAQKSIGMTVAKAAQNLQCCNEGYRRPINNEYITKDECEKIVQARLEEYKMSLEPNKPFHATISYPCILKDPKDGSMVLAMEYIPDDFIPQVKGYILKPWNTYYDIGYAGQWDAWNFTVLVTELIGE